MGRITGDGGWCFHIIDMAVLPQGRTSRFLLTNPDVGCTSGMVSCRLLRVRWHEVGSASAWREQAEQ